jgi:hypothetical protein
VLKRLTGRLEGAEALAHQTAWGALLPGEYVIEAETGSPLALLGEIAVMLRTVDPIEAIAVIDEVAIAALANACHGPRSRVNSP